MLWQLFMIVNSRLRFVIVVAVAAAGSLVALAGPNGDVSPGLLAGRASSLPNDVRDTFRAPAGDLPFSEVVSFRAGKSLFELDLAQALGGTNHGGAVEVGARRCSDCHVGGARGGLRQQGRYDLPALPVVAFRGDTPLPIVGVGLSEEFRKNSANLVWEEIEALIDDRIFRLVAPTIFIGERKAEGVHIRITPPQVGLKLIEEIEDADILSWFDRYRRGRVSWAHRGESIHTASVGRFGFKAQHRSVVSFVAAALEAELGLQADTLGPRRLRMLALYSGELGVPARSASEVFNGEQHFHSFGCQSCHRPHYRIQRMISDKEAPLDIWPFSDFLLHDLGYSEIHPGADDWWRTTPLWGVGRVAATSDFPAHLHDGRARNLREAILWHGGEARAERSRFLAASPAEQRELLEFLGSL